MKNLVPSVLSILMMFPMVACKTNAQYDAGVAGATSAAQANAVKAANFMISVQKGVGAGTTLEVVKFARDNANLVVFSMNSGGPNVYYAIDISQYTAGANVGAYVLSHDVYYGLTDNGNGTFSCNAGTCFNASGPTSSTMVFEKTNVTPKDLDKAASFVEAYQVETMASNIASEYGLSDERSIKVAKLAASWDKLSKTRALTNADADAFSHELAGVSIADMENAEKAMVGGSMSEMNSVLAKAAEVNGTTSENMQSIMMKLFF